MQIIPVINCPDANCAETKLASLKTFLPEGEWIHVDITDGEFSKHATWNDPTAWRNLNILFKTEVHLMVNRPEDYIGAWIAAGANRFVIHAEALSCERAEAIVAMCQNHGVDVLLAFNPETPPESARELFKLFSRFQVLAVPPGPADQAFMPVAFEKIAWLRKEFPHAIIEVDGGMTPDIVRQVKKAGADSVTSEHYIFSSDDPGKAYEELKNI
jgi:ribulose-phosphate 3-epimerase